jgi:hypothetical protein
MLRKLEVRFGSTTSNSTGNAMQLAPRTLHLTTLRLTYCRFSADSLSSLLGACINLKALAVIGTRMAFVKLDLENSTISRHSTLTISDMTRALVSCEHTLEELEVYVMLEDLQHEESQMMFSNFHKLHRLGITRDLLPTRPSDCLPSNLETLELTQYDLEKDLSPIGRSGKTSGPLRSVLYFETLPYLVGQTTKSR